MSIKQQIRKTHISCYWLMKTHNSVLTPIKKVAYATFWFDGLDEEWIYFKLINKESVRKIVHALKSMRLIYKYRLDFHREIYRYGYEYGKWRLRILERDSSLMSLSDIKVLIIELASIVGYELHFITVDKMLNLKIKN